MKEYEKALETYRAGLEHDPENEELKDGVRRSVVQIQRVSRRGQVPVLACVHVEDAVQICRERTKFVHRDGLCIVAETVEMQGTVECKRHLNARHSGNARDLLAAQPVQ
jgi:uncharacterized Fe-S cluster-containing radical SAM superfamily protein